MFSVSITYTSGLVYSVARVEADTSTRAEVLTRMQARKEVPCGGPIKSIESTKIDVNV